MKYSRLLIVAEKQSVVSSYRTLLQSEVSTVETLLLSDLTLSYTFSPCDIIIIDFTSQTNTDKVHIVLEALSETSKTFIISPFSSSELALMLPIDKNVDIMMQKPLVYERFFSLISHFCHAIDRRKMLETKSQLFGEIVELNPSFISVFTFGGILFYANRHFMDEFSINIDAIDILTFDQIRRCDIKFQTILSHLSLYQQYTVQRNENGKWYESHFYSIIDHYIVHICSDITDAKRKELQLEQAAVFFEQSNEALMIADLNGKIIAVNTAFCRITGYTKDEVIGQTPHLLYSGMHEKSFYENLWGSLVHNGSWQGEIWNRRKNGEIYPEWLSINKAKSSRYEEEFYISVFTDISSIKETDRKLYFYANHDPLTGLANRVNFEGQLNKQIETCKRRGIKLALMFIDLDKFKEINDTYGHSTGDAMLKIVSKRFTDSIRTEDFIARIGGDEFVIIAGGGEDPEGLMIFAKKLIDIIKQPITIDKNVFFMSLSIGIAIYPDHGEAAEDLIKHADAAMYEVKESGRNGFMLYEQAFGEKVSLKLNTQNDLIQGIENDQFELFYQPVIDLRQKQVIGAEALVRWHHPEKGLLYPDAFIRVVEESEFIHAFGKMVYAKALHDLTVLRNRFGNNDQFTMAINIFPKQFFNKEFVDDVFMVASDFGMHPSSIELELLETQIMKSPEIAQEVFGKLAQKGFKIALDDFGTGYSSLSYLKLFSLHKLKIDQSFVRDMLIDANDRAIIQTIISMGKIFGMTIHAEGVETSEHATLLEEMGCDVVQGYYYSRPVPLPQFIEWCGDFNEN